MTLPYLSNRCIGEVVQRSTPLLKTTARYTSVDCVTRGINVIAESLTRIGRACNVRLTSIIGDEAVVFDELISTSVIPSVAGTSSTTSTVEDVLDGKVDVHALSFTSNLDTIGEGTHGGKSYNE